MFYLMIIYPSQNNMAWFEYIRTKQQVKCKGD